MSLEGTLETIALPDVLALLSVTAKTGELRIESGGGVGSVWFDAGRVAGFDVGSTKTPVDALFALLRLREGKFKFHTGTEVVNEMPSQDVAPVLEEAENRLAQWPAISAVVPSVYGAVALCPTVEGTVMLRPDQWQLVATVAGGGSIAEVLALRGLGEFDGCKAVKDLVDLRLVEVKAGSAPAGTSGLKPAPPGRADPAPKTTGAAPGPAADRSAQADSKDRADGAVEGAAVADLSQVWNDETGEVEAAGSEEVTNAAGNPVNRGLLLKFLGSARN